MRLFKRLLTLLVIAWGLLALVVRLATPIAEDYRESLAALASDRLGTPVRIGRLKARWYGFRPMLELGGVHVGESHEVLEIDRALLDLRLRSLLTRRLSESLRVTVDGMALSVIREPGGQLHLGGLGDIGGGAPGGPTGTTPWLPAHIRLLNTRLVWIDRRADARPLRVDDLDLLFDRDGERSRLRLHLQTEAGHLRGAAEITGSLFGTDWSGTSYLQTDDLDLARLLAGTLPHDYGLERLTLDGRAWLDWRQARPVAARGSLRFGDLALRPGTDEAPLLQLKGLATDFGYHDTGSERQLGLENFRLDLAERQWPGGRIALGVAEMDDTHRFRLRMDYLRLDDLSRIALVRLPFPEIWEALVNLEPSGEIRDLKLDLTSGDTHRDWRIDGVIDDLGLRSWQHIPGLSHVSGRLRADPDHLMMELDADAVEIDTAGLFREPLSFDRIEGRLDAIRGEHGWQLRSERMVADSPHIRTVSRFALKLPPDAAPFLDLKTDFRDGDGRFASRYYPTAIMSPNLIAWLDRAIVSGRVESGSAIFHGPLDEFAFEKTRSGSFQVLFDARDVILDYRRGWPRIEEIDARVGFRGNQLDIRADDGRIYRTRLKQASAHIDSLHPISPLQVKGTAAGPLHDVLRILGEPALRGNFGEVAQVLTASGNSDLGLDLAIPLSSERGRPRLDGRLDFNNAGLRLPQWDFGLAKIHGRLQFTLDGLHARGIRAVALAAPLTVDIETDEEGRTRILSRGRIGVDAIARQLPSFPLETAGGKAGFEVSIDIPRPDHNGERHPILQVESGLQGIDIDLPGPLGKAADQTRTLTTRIPLDGGTGSLDYGGVVSTRFAMDGRSADVMLGGQAARASAAPGIRVRGHLAELDLAAWQAALDRRRGDETADLPPTEIDLRLDRILAGTTTLRDVALMARRDADGAWAGEVNAPLVAGSFEIPDAATGRPARIALQRLQIELAEESGPPGPVPDPAAGPDPAGWPAIELDIAQLNINRADLGKATLRARRVPHGLHFPEIQTSGGQIEVDAEGHWQRYEGLTSTRLSAAARFDDLGKLLEDLGYSHSVADSSGQFDVAAIWPGDPGKLHGETVSGTLSMTLGTGRLVEVEPGVGRFVGLLNLGALARRLTLDFRDLFQKGFSFDGITSEFTLDGGLAHTENTEIHGPTGRIRLSGSADLKARTLDQSITVVPNLDATLPIASTLAAGPVAGVAVYVAQKVLSDQVDAVNRFEYRLSGPWDNPKMERLDSGGTLSRILGPFSGDQGGATATGAPAPTARDHGERPANGAAGPEPGTAQHGGPDAPGQSRNPLRGLIKLLEKGESHGSDLPGSGN